MRVGSESDEDALSDEMGITSHARFSGAGTPVDRPESVTSIRIDTHIAVSSMYRSEKARQAIFGR